MYTQPRGFKPRGQLRACDRCGFEHRRWKELRLQNGLWLCPQCLDWEVRKRARGAGTTFPHASSSTTEDTEVAYTGITFNGTDAYFSNDNPQTTLAPGLNHTVIEWDQKVGIPIDSFGMVIATGADQELGGIDIWWDGVNLISNIYYLPEDLVVVVTSGNLNSIINDGLTHRFSLTCGRLTDAYFNVDGVLTGTPSPMTVLEGKSISIPKCWIGNNPNDPTHFRLPGTIYGLNWMNGTTVPTPVTSPLTKLQATSYSVGYWPMSETTGAIVDTEGSISLSANGTPLYGVTGP